MTLNHAILKEYLGVAIEAARKGADLLEGKIQSRVVSDFSRDVKIEADKLIHEFLTRFLGEKTSLPVLSEEGSLPDQPFDGLQWIIDPIDGSLNFSRSIPFSCISIALWNKREPLIGIVYDFLRKELFSGLVGAGAWLNDQPIKVGETSARKNAVLCTGFPVSTNFGSDSLIPFIHHIQDFKKIRLLGSAALSLSYVASGRVDFYQEKHIALWDVAAGLALVKAAYGKIEFTETEKKLRFHVKAGNGGLFAFIKNDTEST